MKFKGFINKRKSIILVIGAFLLVITFFYYGLFINKQNNTIPFNIYEPTVMPNEAVITDRLALSIYPTDPSPRTVSYQLVINNGEIAVNEKPYNIVNNYYEMYNQCDNNNYDYSQYIDCQELKSPNGVKYILSKYYNINEETIDINNPHTFTVRFIKEGLPILIGVNNGSKYKDYDWGLFIDSFKQVEQPKDLKIEYQSLP